MSSFGLSCFMQTVYLTRVLQSILFLADRLSTPALYFFLLLAHCSLQTVSLLVSVFSLSCWRHHAEWLRSHWFRWRWSTSKHRFEEAMGSIFNIWCLFCLSPRSIMYMYVGLNSTASGAGAPFHAKSEVLFCTHIFISIALVTKTSVAIHLLFQWACNAVIVILYSWLLQQESRRLSQVVKISIIIDLASQFHPWWWWMTSISSVVFRGPHLSCRVLTAFYQRCLFLFWCISGYDLVSF